MPWFIWRVQVVVYIAGTVRGSYSGYMPWCIKRAHAVVYRAGTNRGL
jgi:hypothetical protein